MGACGSGPPRLMFVELAEHLRCLEDHPESFLVLLPERSDGREILSGTIGCPVCHAEYRVDDAVVHCETPGEAEHRTASVPGSIDVLGLQAMVDLSGPGGFVVVVGSVSRLANDLAESIGGVQCVAVNPPADVVSATPVSVVRAPRIPLRTSMARAVVLGADYGDAFWVAEPNRRLQD